MNERLMDFLWRSEVAKLPEKKRRLYEFIIEAENSLAETAETAEEFCRLLLADSPVNLAVQHFHLPYERVVSTIMEIEEELNRKIALRSKKVKWIDFSEGYECFPVSDGTKKLFLFMN